MRLFTEEGREGNYFVETNYGPLLVDTGAGSSQLPFTDETAKLPALRAAETHGCIGTATRQFVRVQQLCCGEMVAEDLEVTLDERLHLLGNDVLRHYCFTFDLHRKELIVIAPFVTEQPCRLGKKFHLFTKVSLNGECGLAMVDTGCAISTIDRDFVKSALGCVQPQSSESVTDSTGVTQWFDKIYLDNMLVQDVPFPIQPFIMMDYNPLNRALGFPIVATIGASSMELKKFSFNQRDGFLKIDDYDF